MLSLFVWLNNWTKPAITDSTQTNSLDNFSRHLKLCYPPIITSLFLGSFDSWTQRMRSIWLLANDTRPICRENYSFFVNGAVEWSFWQPPRSKWIIGRQFILLTAVEAWFGVCYLENIWSNRCRFIARSDRCTEL